MFLLVRTMGAGRKLSYHIQYDSLDPADLYPKHFHIDYYRNIFMKRPFLTYLKNSIIVSVSTTVISVFWHPSVPI